MKYAFYSEYKASPMAWLAFPLLAKEIFDTIRGAAGPH